ncbi:MAG: hypothetical protein ABL994_21520 [Verrucomicrobiales bacterium]
MVALLLGLIHQSAPPDLEAVAAQLRKTGATVQVSNAEDPAWEIWVDHNGPLNKDTLKPFRGIKRLTALRIFSDDLTDAHLRDIRDNPDLNLLVVMSKKLTDASMISIAKIGTLTKLDLNKGTWTAKGLRRLSALKKLERLYLYNANIADDQFSPLAELKQVKLIDLPKSVSETTLAKLRKALPNTAINRGP